MMMPVIAYPVIDPVLINIGPVPIRWYALAYIVGLVLGWAYAGWIVAREAFWGGLPRPTRASLDDLIVYVAIGVVFGGRLGYVLFYNPGYYLVHPEDIVKVWNGGMSFHGGLAGAALGIWAFARRAGVPVLSVGDICSAVAPIGLFLGRIANFIKPELWGRPSDVAWAMVFPDAGPQPRHPSQLYEAGLEGLLLGLVLAFFFWRTNARNQPGKLVGIFLLGYGASRFIVEYFREPDVQLGTLSWGLTMGQTLTVPMLIGGIYLIATAAQRKAISAE